MDLRKWFWLQDKPRSSSWEKTVACIPASEYRCPTVMRVFLAGTSYGFRLTDLGGYPTETLRVMVSAMGAELCQTEDLPKEERHRFTDLKGGKVDPIFNGRWFIRNISTRLRHEGSGARCTYSWPWHMFKTDKHLGLMNKQITEHTTEGPRRRWRYLVVCPPDWHLNPYVYEGLCHWHGDHIPRRYWDSYEFLGWVQSAGRDAAQAWKAVSRTDGHAQVVLDAG